MPGGVAALRGLAAGSGLVAAAGRAGWCLSGSRQVTVRPGTAGGGRPGACLPRGRRWLPAVRRGAPGGSLRAAARSWSAGSARAGAGRARPGRRGARRFPASSRGRAGPRDFPAAGGPTGEPGAARRSAVARLGCVPCPAAARAAWRPGRCGLPGAWRGYGRRPAGRSWARGLGLFIGRRFPWWPSVVPLARAVSGNCSGSFPVVQRDCQAPHAP